MDKLKIQGFLKEIIELKKQDIDEAIGKTSLNHLRKEAESRPIEADFIEALKKNSHTHAGIIAEIAMNIIEKTTSFPENSLLTAFCFASCSAASLLIGSPAPSLAPCS